MTIPRWRLALMVGALVAFGAISGGLVQAANTPPASTAATSATEGDGRAFRAAQLEAVRARLGANEPWTDRSRFRAEFDWTGTGDPTAYLALPAAIDWMAASAPDDGGWPAVMAENHQLAIAGRDRIAAALGVAPAAPDSMLGAMAALPVPCLRDEAAAEALGRRLEMEDGVQVPIGGWPVRAAWAGDDPERILIRISAQRYNEPADYDRLAEALVRRLGRP